MPCARTINGEISDNDEVFGLVCAVAASGEALGGPVTAQPSHA